MADQSGEPSKKRTKKTSKGLCITVDRVDVKNETDINTVEKAFSEIGCTVWSIKDYHNDTTKKKVDRKKYIINEFRKIANQSANEDYSYVVIFITEKRDKIKKDTIRIVNNNFTDELDKVAGLKGKPRIVINHVWLKATEQEPVALNSTPSKSHVKPNEIHIVSKIEACEGSHNQIESSFVGTFCKTFKECFTRLSVIELVTRILRERELGDFFKVNTNGNHRETRTDPRSSPSSSNGSRSHSEEEEERDPHYNIFEEVTFEPHRHYDTEAKLITGTESDSPNGHSPVSSTSEPPLRRLEDRSISKLEMVKLLSMKIESKEQKIPHYKVRKYEMNRSLRGFCVIINQSNDRAGAFVDEVRMHKLFQDELFFEVKLIHNKKHDDIKTKVQSIVREMNNGHQCVFVFLMAHGNQIDKEHLFYDVTGEERCSNYIFDEFKNCSALKHKPKIFIIQTCFGENTMDPNSPDGTTGEDSEKSGTKSDFRSAVPYVPMGTFRHIASDRPSTPSRPVQCPINAPAHRESDTLSIHSTLAGFKSYRHMVYGSSLIQHIDRIFRESAARNDINKLMTDVNGLVSDEVFFESERQQPIGKDNTLNANLYLNPGYIQTHDSRIPDTPTRDPIKGSVLWSAKTDDVRLVMVASETTKGVFEFKILNLDDTEAQAQKLEKDDDDDANNLTHISSGVMIAKNKHLVVADKDETNRKVVFMFVSGDDKWSLGTELDVEKPIALCAINNDGFGILSEQTKKNRAHFEAYHRKQFDIDAGVHFAQDNIQSEVFLRLTYGNMSSRDQVVYHRTKILILSVIDCTVTRFDMNGNLEFTVGGPELFREGLSKEKFFNPCSMFWSSIPDEKKCTQLVVACCNAIHTADIKQNKIGDWIVKFKEPKEIDTMIDRMWYDGTDFFYLVEDFINYNKVEVSANAFKEIKTDEMKKINDGWLRQTIWATQDGELVIGGAQATDISVIDRQSFEVLFTINPMTHGTYGRITSGFCSGPKTHVIISGEDPEEIDNKKEINKKKDIGPTNGNGNGNNGNGHGYPTQWIVKLDDNNNITDVVRRVNHRKLERHPVVMFPVDDKRYGVICKESGVTKYAIIELRDKQEHKLKRTLKVQHESVHINDHACVDRTGNIFMSSFKQGLVNKFDRHGKKLAEFNKIDMPPGAESFSRLAQPYTLLLGSEGHLIVQCCNAMYKLNDDTGKWEQISGFVGPAWDMCCVGSKMYTIYKEEFIPWEIDSIEVTPN